jgi:uncharacterized protein
MVQSEILQALYTGRDDELTRLLALEPDLDVFEAAAVGRTAHLHKLLDDDRELATAWSGDGFTALHLAAFFGQLAAARLLVDHGADVRAVSRNPMAVEPLHSAAAKGSVEVCNLLLENGADPNARQQGGWVPLHAAAANGNRELEDLLVSHGADPSIANESGQTADDLRRSGA